MKNQDNEIKNKILKCIKEHQSELNKLTPMFKMIEEHKSEIKKYEKLLQLLNKEPLSNKQGGVRIGAGRPKSIPSNSTYKEHLDEVRDEARLERLTKEEIKNKPKIKNEIKVDNTIKLPIKSKKKNKVKAKGNKLPSVSWEKLILPLLEKSETPMSVNQMADVLFKFKKRKNREVLVLRMYSALSTLRRNKKIVTTLIKGKVCYGLHYDKVQDKAQASY